MRNFHDTITLAFRILLGGIFLLAGLTKVGEPGAFADAVRAYHLMPPELVVPFAFMVPWLEILVAAYLLFGFLTRFGAAGAALLLVMFTVALVDALMTGNTAHPCGCFGKGTNPILGFLAGGDTITWWDPVRDMILLGMSVWLVLRGAGRFSADAALNARRDDVVQAGRDAGRWTRQA